MSIPMGKMGIPHVAVTSPIPKTMPDPCPSHTGKCETGVAIPSAEL